MTQILENPHVASNNARNLPRHIPAHTIPQILPQFDITMKVIATSEPVVTDYCVAHLRERGYYVAAPNEKWESAGAFCKRVGANKSALHTLIARYQARGGRPPELDRRGKSQRVTAIRSHEGFDTFCRSLCRDSRKAS